MKSTPKHAALKTSRPALRRLLCHMRRRIHVCHMRRRIHASSMLRWRRAGRPWGGWPQRSR